MGGLRVMDAVLERCEWAGGFPKRGEVPVPIRREGGQSRIFDMLFVSFRYPTSEADALAILRDFCSWEVEGRGYGDGSVVESSKVFGSGNILRKLHRKGG